MRSGTVCLLIAAILTFLAPGTLRASSLTGYVVWVTDGDTLTVLDQDFNLTTIRLYGIDTPEKGQAYGFRAYIYTVSHTMARKVGIDPVEKDRYGRVVARLYIDGRSLAEDLIAGGAAWVYDRYCRSPECSRLRDLEKRAREQGKGLWAGSAEPMPPWQWRHLRD